MTPPTYEVSFDADRMVQNLLWAPSFLRELLSNIPAEMLKQARKPGKWTIHEHAVHMTMVDDIMIPRLEAFRSQAEPKIVPYNPSEAEKAGSLLEMELNARLDCFDDSRERLIDAFSLLNPADYDKHADHPEYREYTPRVMLRHLMMHDYLHCYRIEELWLTRDERLN
ncbi:MAG: DinB family protein [Candidatus Sumerlaeaceae bacterium]